MVRLQLQKIEPEERAGCGSAPTLKPSARRGPLALPRREERDSHPTDNERRSEMTEKKTDDEEEPLSPAVERWLEEFKKLSVDEQREVKRRFFEEFFPELLDK